MKTKFALVVPLLLCVVFCACRANVWSADDFVVTNASSKNVSFKVKNYGEAVHSLNAGASMVLQLFDHPSFIFVDNPRVAYSSSFSSAMFYDMKRRTYEVSNNSFYDVVLSENNNMLTDVYGGTETIPAATANQKPDGTYDVVASKKDVAVYGEYAPQFSAYYIGADGQKVDATKFISYAAKN